MTSRDERDAQARRRQLTTVARALPLHGSLSSPCISVHVPSTSQPAGSIHLLNTTSGFDTKHFSPQLNLRAPPPPCVLLSPRSYRHPPHATPQVVARKGTHRAMLLMCWVCWGCWVLSGSEVTVSACLPSSTMPSCGGNKYTFCYCSTVAYAAETVGLPSPPPATRGLTGCTLLYSPRFISHHS